MKINPRDREVDFYSCYIELDNPNAIRAKKSSNKVFLICALILAVFLLILVGLKNHNRKLNATIDENSDYANNPQIVEAYNAKEEIKKKSKAIMDYNAVSETYLGQLEKSARFSSEWVEFFKTALNTAVGAGSRIKTFDYANDGIMRLECASPNPEQPKLYAQYLSELKNEVGEKRFFDVTYTGFSGNGGEYIFSIDIRMWADPEKESQKQLAEQAAADAEAAAAAAEE